MSAPHGKNFLPASVVAASALAFLVTLAVSCRRYWAFTLDDAFITLRYSAHLAQGLGPSWNPGGPPAEGYTTTLWMALLALLLKLGADGLLAAKLAGVVFAPLAIGAASWLASSLTRAHPPLLRALAASTPWLFAIAYWPLSLHAVSGMETTCSAFVLTLFFALAQRDSRLHPRALALCALAAVLTRPEAALPCGVTLLALYALEPTKRAALLRAVALYTVLPGALYFTLRYSHFGLLFPLSFYVKATGQEPLAGWEDVRDFFALFLVRQPLWGALAIAGALRARSAIPALLGALAFSIFFLFPEHIMAFEGRYMVPLAPLVAALAGAGVARASALVLARARTSGQRALSWSAVCAVLALVTLWPISPEASSRRWLDYGRDLTRAHVTFAHALRQTRPDGSIAMLDVGAVGYYADWDTLDTFGLNDAHVAVTHRTDVDYVFAREPDLLVVVSATPAHYAEVFPWETPLYREAVRRGYRYLCDYEFQPNYQLQVLARVQDPERDRGVCRYAAMSRTGASSAH